MAKFTPPSSRCRRFIGIRTLRIAHTNVTPTTLCAANGERKEMNG